MVMSGRSIHLTTLLSWASLIKRGRMDGWRDKMMVMMIKMMMIDDRFGELMMMIMIDKGQYYYDDGCV